ncbi:hypothetical protein [Streptomyces cyaneofuscatus]|uniref:hypothetical protein n=1 Tax=Streptomyces cyaneofuscatus TaxID=66883 RepID=UPI0036D8E7E6
MAWNEWEQLKAEAAARHDSGMRLNSAGNHAGAPDLSRKEDLWMSVERIDNAANNGNPAARRLGSLGS